MHGFPCFVCLFIFDMLVKTYYFPQCFSGWHICSSCQKKAHYVCYTCTYSLCKSCVKGADYIGLRETKGLCGTCRKTIMLIENIMPANEEKVWYYLFMCGLLTSVCVGCQTYGRSLFFSLVISVVIMVSFFFFFLWPPRKLNFEKFVFIYCYVMFSKLGIRSPDDGKVCVSYELLARLCACCLLLIRLRCLQF